MKCPICKGELMDKCDKCNNELKGDNLMCGVGLAYHCVNCYKGAKK